MPLPIATATCLFLAVPLAAPVPPEEGGRTLIESIADLNARTEELRIELDQSPLTEDEVLAVLRWTVLEETLPISLTRISVDDPFEQGVFGRLRSIIDTGVLPEGAWLEVLSAYEPDDVTVFDVWSVRLKLPRIDGDGSFAVSIRERMIRSRVMGAEERKIVEAWRARWRGGIPGMARAELMARFRRERDEAIRRDQRAREGDE